MIPVFLKAAVLEGNVRICDRTICDYEMQALREHVDALDSRIRSDLGAAHRLHDAIDKASTHEDAVLLSGYLPALRTHFHVVAGVDVVVVDKEDKSSVFPVGIDLVGAAPENELQVF